MKQLVSLALISILASVCFSQHINISIFNDFHIKTVVITPVAGKYDIIADDSSVFKLETNSIIYLTLIGDSISIRDLDKSFGVFKKIEVRGTKSL